MSKNKPVEKRHKKEFWYLVQRCLIKFHGVPKDLAKEKMKGARKKVGMIDLTYHDEPFNCASTIVGSPPDREWAEEQKKEYLRMRNEAIVHCGAGEEA